MSRPVTRREALKGVAQAGALLGGRLLEGTEVARIAELPPRDVLLGQVAGAFMSPMAGLVNTLNGVVQALVLVLDARRAQLAGSAE